MDSASPPSVNFTLHPLDWTVILAYLIGIVLMGIWFGGFTKNTMDFFLGGQRFSWWVGSVACVATLVGSYSFIQYSQNGFNFGLSSVTAYTNDWFVLPFFLLVWIPIIYYSRLTSIPEYFERRFDRRTRIAVLVIMLVYLQGYIGINLYTIGVAMHGLLGWDVTLSAAVISLLTGMVIYAGGAMAVMMADLLQAFLLPSEGASGVISSGMKSPYMRSLFGLVVSGVLGVVLSLYTRPKPKEDISGLVLGTLRDGMRRFKGGEPNEQKTQKSAPLDLKIDQVEPGKVRLPHAVMVKLNAQPGDLLYLSDQRWWLGGLRSVHVTADQYHGIGDAAYLSEHDVERGNLRRDRKIRVERIL